jgi:hypothetical protein
MLGVAFFAQKIGWVLGYPSLLLGDVTFLIFLLRSVAMLGFLSLPLSLFRSILR